MGIYLRIELVYQLALNSKTLYIIKDSFSKSESWTNKNEKESISKQEM